MQNPVFQGCEADRDTLKSRCTAAYVGSMCPGAETCRAAGDVHPGAYGRIVRIQITEQNPTGRKLLEIDRLHGLESRAFFPKINWSNIMARVCQVTGKGPMAGNHVSHANNRTKRRFLPNLQYRRFWIESENRWLRLRVSNAGLRTIDKNGIDVVLADLRARGEI